MNADEHRVLFGFRRGEANNKYSLPLFLCGLK